MSGVAVKWAVRRYQPARGVSDLQPKGHKAQTYAEWRDVCIAADTILGDHGLKMGIEPDVPVVIQQGEDIVLIYIELEAV